MKEMGGKPLTLFYQVSKLAEIFEVIIHIKQKEKT